MKSSHIFSSDPQGSWIPQPCARGPFDGIQGGAIAGLMCLEIERQLSNDWRLANLTTHLLRPTPLSSLHVRIQKRKKGKRVAFIDAELVSGDAVVALQRATAVKAIVNMALPVAGEERAEDPRSFVQIHRAAPHGQPWMMDTMEVRRAHDSLTWLRMHQNIAEGSSGVTKLLAIADWAHGLGLPLGALEETPYAIPNTDLTVHLFRPPKGEWIGLDHTTAWSTDSIGTGWALIRDLSGPVGRVAMSIAITALRNN